MINEFADAIDLKAVHVVAPTDFVFLCGGQDSPIDEPQPKSLRDAFYKISDFAPLGKTDVKRAEDVSAFHILKSGYDDILSFETDFGQLAKLTLLFSESHGSSAELGAFCLVSEIARRMLVVVRSKHYEESSFIKFGAIELMKTTYGEFSHFVIDDTDLALKAGSPTPDTVAALKALMQDPIERRLSEIENPTTFDRNKAGHVTKLVVGLVQEFGALTEEEVTTLLVLFDIDLNVPQLRRYLLCAEVADWVMLKRKGFRNYAVARNLPRDAANFRFLPGTLDRTATRRRADRRATIKAQDKERFSVILDGIGGANV
ncbi:MAG: retron St85 family effector protein [Altererythrobacter sp.]|nr:retron St85 family effector protein [Altererythrobacter sp.]